MRFESPGALLLGSVLPILIGGYLWQLRRRRRAAVRFSSVALVRAASPGLSRLRRVVPMVLFVAGACALVAAGAQPQMSETVAIGRTTIILALDVSRSMCATDVAPNRLAVSQAAARDFVKHQQRGTRIGLVEFAGLAELVGPPTTDRDALVASIDAMTTAPGTAIGAALLASVDAIASVNPDVTASTPIDLNNPTPATPPGRGGYVPDIVVLLTDGANTQGVEPYLAARQASVRKLRVYTIGFGTTKPSALACSAQQLGADALSNTDNSNTDNSNTGAGGPGSPAPAAEPPALLDDPTQYFVIDESALEEVAHDTGGAYFRARDAPQLKAVFSKLPKKVELQQRAVEISAVFAAAGAFLTATALALSFVWRRWP